MTKSNDRIPLSFRAAQAERNALSARPPLPPLPLQSDKLRREKRPSRCFSLLVEAKRTKFGIEIRRPGEGYRSHDEEINKM